MKNILAVLCMFLQGLAATISLLAGAAILVIASVLGKVQDLEG